MGRFHLSIVRGYRWPEAAGGASWSSAGDWLDSSTAQGLMVGGRGFGRGAGGKGPPAFKLKSKKKKALS